jgi:predicted nucleic acid-binding protein
VQETEKWLRVYSATLDTNIFMRSMIRMDNLSNKLISLWLDEHFILVLPQAVIFELWYTELNRTDIL